LWDRNSPRGLEGCSQNLHWEFFYRRAPGVAVWARLFRAVESESASHLSSGGIAWPPRPGGRRMAGGAVSVSFMGWMGFDPWSSGGPPGQFLSLRCASFVRFSCTAGQPLCAPACRLLRRGWSPDCWGGPRTEDLLVPLGWLAPCSEAGRQALRWEGVSWCIGAAMG